MNVEANGQVGKISAAMYTVIGNFFADLRLYQADQQQWLSWSTRW